MKNNNIYSWWLEAEQPIANQAPQSDPFSPGQAGQIPPQQPPQTPPPGQDPSTGEGPDPDDVTQDPQEIEEPQRGEQDYEQWKHDFMEAAIKADNEEMINMLNSVRDRQLEPPQRKFVEDNIQIFMFRRDASILKASKEVRNLVKQELDRTNPGTTVMQHLTKALDANPLLYQGLIKLGGTFAWKADLHRKWIAALLGAVQVGGGATNKDLVICEKDYDINLSTRFATQWGEINIGKWSLIESDPKEYLKPDELENLQDGAPEEKQVLRRKIIVKAVGEMYRKRAFIVHVVSTDGTIYSLGWDLGNSLLEAYKAGKVVVRGRESDEREIMIGDDGEIIPVIDYSLLFVRETGEVDDSGRPETNEVDFITRRDSTLYLTADLETLKAASSGLSGMFFHQIPYAGQPGEVLQLQRAIPGLYELISRQVT